MNVLFDDFVDGVLGHVQQTILPTLETFTQKTSDRLSAPRPTPSSTDMVYITDRLIALSQPASSQVSKYTDKGRDFQETSNQPPKPVQQPLDVVEVVAEDDNKDINPNKQQHNTKENFQEQQQDIEPAPEKMEDEVPVFPVENDDSHGETDTVRQSLVRETEEIPLVEESRSQQEKSEAPNMDTESELSQQPATDDKLVDSESASLEEETTTNQVGQIMTNENDETDSSSKSEITTSLPQHAQVSTKPIVNSPATIITYLDKRHGTDHYLAYSLMDTPPDDRTLILFRRQIVQMGWWSPCIERSETPSISKLIKLCYAIHAYLELDSSNVAMVYCSNGKTRTAIAMACYLKFAGMVQHSYQGFLYFLSKRGIAKPEATWRQLPPSLHNFFRQFDSALEIGGFLNRKPLLLRAIALQGIPVDEKPCLDIWDSSKRHVYSSHPEVWNKKEGGNTNEDENNELSSQWGDEEGFYKVNVILEGDFLLLCRFGGEFASETTIHDPSKILFRYANTTGFLSGGCPHELPSNRVDLMRQYASHFDEEDFLVTLLFEADWEEAQYQVNVDSREIPAELRARRKCLKRPSRSCNEKVWRSYERMSCEEGWKIIYGNHSAKPDPSDIKNFQRMYSDDHLEQCPSNLVGLALQLTNFEYKRAKQLLCEAPPFAWWHQELVKDSKLGVSSQSEEDKKLVDENESATQILNILAQVDVTKNLDPADVVQLDAFEKQVSILQEPRIRNDDSSPRSVKRKTDLCLRDAGWMVPSMAFPRQGDIAARFGTQYEQMQTKVDQSMPTFESDVLPRMPFFPHDRPSVIPIPSKRRKRGLQETESIHWIPAYDERREMARELLTQINHTGVTLPGLVSLVESSQRWKGVPELLEEESDMKAGTQEIDEEQEGIRLSFSMENTMNREAKEKKENEWEEAKKVEEAKKREEREKAEETKRIKEGGAPLKDDPEYSKYFKMLKMGMQKEQVAHALTRDGKDLSIIDLDPNKSLKSQWPTETKEENGEVPLKDDPEFSKYFKMLKMGMPKEQVAHALTRDEKDLSILELDPEKSLKSQKSDERKGEKEIALKDDPEYLKYFKMLSMGLPLDAVKNALLRDGKDPKVMDLDRNKSIKSQQKGTKEETDLPSLKDDPDYAKYFKMLSMGLPVDAVKNALVRDSKDPTIMDLDPNKSLKSQLGQNEEKDLGIPIKDDPEYKKYFKMLGMGLPIDAVKNALSRDGKDPNIMDLDPNKSLAFQSKTMKTDSISLKPSKKKKKIRRKKIYWNTIQSEKLKPDSMWHIVKDAIDINKLSYDEEEFQELFTESADQGGKKKVSPEKAKKKLVQVIDTKRSMNGAIILKRLKIDYEVISKYVTKMDYNKFDSTQLAALKEYLANNDERRGLIAYMRKGESSPEVKEQLYADLSETEKYMYTMMDVSEPHAKFDAMLFRTVFKNRFEDVNAGIQTLNSACDELRSSEKLRKLMAMILTVVNQINTGGEGNLAVGFTLDALLKLNEAKAFDKKTSVLHYVVKLVKKNDESLLTFSSDIAHVIPAESVLLDALGSEVESLTDDLKSVHVTVQAEAERLEQAGELKPMSLADLREQRTSIRHSGTSPQYNQMDHHTGRTSMERFTVNAHYSCDSASAAIKDVKKKYVALLHYFGEDEEMATADFFGILRRFMAEWRKAVEQVEKIEKRKAKEKKRASAKAAKAAKRETRNSRQGSKKSPSKRKENARKKSESKAPDQAIGSLAAAAAKAALKRKGNKSENNIEDYTKGNPKSFVSGENIAVVEAAVAASRDSANMAKEEKLPSAQIDAPDEHVNTSKESQEKIKQTQEVEVLPESWKETNSPEREEEKKESSAVDVPTNHQDTLMPEILAAAKQSLASKKRDESEEAQSKSELPGISEDIKQQQSQHTKEDNEKTPIIEGESQKKGDAAMGDKLGEFGESVVPQKMESDATKTTGKLFGLTVITSNLDETVSKDESPPFSSTRSRAKTEGKSHFAAKAAAYRNRKKKGETDILGSPISQKPKAKVERPKSTVSTKSPSTPSRASKFLSSATEYRKKKAGRELTNKDNEDDTEKVSGKVASAKDQTQEVSRDSTLIIINNTENDDTKEATKPEEHPKDLSLGKVTEIDPPVEGVSIGPQLGAFLDTQRTNQADISNSSKLGAFLEAPINQKNDIPSPPRLGAFLESQRQSKKSELTDFLDDDRSEMLRQNFDDSSVAHIAEQLHRQSGQSRMSGAWSEGDNITNWMNWADEAVVMAGDSESVADFQTPRDLNEGEDFDDDSTIASFTSYASTNYDDLSVASSLATPRHSIDNVDGSPATASQSFDPYLPKGELKIDANIASSTPKSVTPASVAASILFEDSPVNSVQFTQDASQGQDAGLSLPGIEGYEIGLDSGLTFGADVGFDDGLGGFGDSYNYGDYTDGNYDNGTYGNEAYDNGAYESGAYDYEAYDKGADDNKAYEDGLGMASTEPPADEKGGNTENKRNWFSWGGN